MKKYLKYLGYTLLAILGLLIVTGYIGIRKFHSSLFKEKPNHLVYTSEFNLVRFVWENDSIGDYLETQIAMMIPFRIEGLSHKFYMQFDTGSPNTFIYENDLKSLKRVGLNFKEIVIEDERYVQNIKFVLGGNNINASMIKILDGYGNTFDKNDTTGRINIGTIGSDFMENRITTIDFKNQTLQFHNNRPKWMASLPDFEPFDFQGRRFMLPATINGKRLELLYDSGCSAFGLITTKNRFDSYTDEKTEEIKYEANSWGNDIPIRHKATDKKMQIGNANLGLKRISYVNMYVDYQSLMTPFTRIGGWLGNRPFSESTLILDTKKEEFIVIESSVIQ